MKLSVFFIIFFLTQSVVAQNADTITINVKEQSYFDKKNVDEPTVEGYKLDFPLNNYFKKSTPDGYYIVNYQLGDVVAYSSEGLLINGKFDGKWTIKNHVKEITSTFEFQANRFEGEQLFYTNNKLSLKIICKKNEIVYMETFNSNGELMEIRIYANGILVNSEINGLNPEFRINKQ